jgi:hypothetical protein
MSIVIAIALLTAAQEQGASVSVEIVPGGHTALFNSPTEAQAACTGAGGNFGLQQRRFVCVNPRGPVRSTRTDAAPPAASESGTTGSDAEVESLTLRPGEVASFTLAQGGSHQLLRRAAADAAGAITIRYESNGGASTIIASSRTGYPLTFSVLADPDGNGGFSPVGEVALPGDGTPARLSRNGVLGAISVGSFTRR